jgi:hypothetical protein
LTDSHSFTNADGEPHQMQPPDSDVVPAKGPAITPPADNDRSLTSAGGSARLWLITLAAGVAAGLVAWVGGEACLDRIKPPVHNVNSKGVILRLTDRREVAAAEAQNAGVAFAILGAALGASLGAAGGLAGRSGRRAVSAALAGVVLGSAVAVATSIAVLPPYNAYKARYPDDAAKDLILPLLVHAGIWSAVGGAGGLAFALGFGARSVLSQAVIGGLVGAAVAAVAYEMIGAVGFTNAQTAQFVSATWQTRLFARVAITVLAAVGVALGVYEPRRRPVPPPT